MRLLPAFTATLPALALALTGCGQKPDSFETAMRDAVSQTGTSCPTLNQYDTPAQHQARLRVVAEHITPDTVDSIIMHNDLRVCLDRDLQGKQQKAMLDTKLVASYDAATKTVYIADDREPQLAYSIFGSGLNGGPDALDKLSAFITANPGKNGVAGDVNCISRFPCSSIEWRQPSGFATESRKNAALLHFSPTKG